MQVSQYQQQRGICTLNKFETGTGNASSGKKGKEKDVSENIVFE